MRHDRSPARNELAGIGIHGQWLYVDPASDTHPQARDAAEDGRAAEPSLAR